MRDFLPPSNTSMQNAVYTMTPAERCASIGLASIYGLRMLGLFIILPVFALYAEHLPGGESHLLMGLALGAYGLTQAILQIPAGWLSDRYGRKPVIYISLILFALGSFVAASADNIYWVIVGRVVLAVGVVKWVIPDPAITRFHSDTEASWGHLAEVLYNKELLRLDFGIFSLH